MKLKKANVAKKNTRFMFFLVSLLMFFVNNPTITPVNPKSTPLMVITIFCISRDNDEEIEGTNKPIEWAIKKAMIKIDAQNM